MALCKNLFHHRRLKSVIEKGQDLYFPASFVRLWQLRVEIARRGFRLTAPASLQLHLSNTLSVNPYFVNRQPPEPACISRPQQYRSRTITVLVVNEVATSFFYSLSSSLACLVRINRNLYYLTIVQRLRQVHLTVLSLSSEFVLLSH